jgi:hypothetical protein
MYAPEEVDELRRYYIHLLGKSVGSIDMPIKPMSRDPLSGKAWRIPGSDVYDVVVEPISSR